MTAAREIEAVSRDRAATTIGSTLRDATEFLRERAVPSPRVDAEHLLAKALAVERVDLYTGYDRPLAPRELAEARGLLRRRAAREPLAYILGEWGFRRLTLRVDPRVLIPRPETEVVVDRCLALLAGEECPDVLDAGTGSGAIALAIADEHPGAHVTAFDSSPDALAVARENAARTGLAERVRFVEHDLRSGFGATRFDLVVSNPPYVDPDEIESLEPEGRDWEPRLALVSRDATEAVARAATQALRPGGWLVVEVGDGRAARIADALAAIGYADVRISPDLAGRERVVEGQWPA